MFYAGRKENGKYYLGTFWGYQEVSEEVYYGYMQLVWKEQKARQREFRCFDGTKKCTGNCSECEMQREGMPLSLDLLFEDDEFDVPYPDQRSVEDTVITKLMIEALYKEISKLPSEEQFIISALYLFDDPLSQTQIGEVLGISQQMVSKKKNKAMETLKKAMEDWK